MGDICYHLFANMDVGWILFTYEECYAETSIKGVGK